MGIHAIAIRFTIFPFSIVYISVRVDEYSLPVSYIIRPTSLILGPIGPGLYASTVSHLLLPFSGVGDS